jgi:putative phosphoribosyl transferase
MTHLESAGERPVFIRAGAAQLPGTVAWPRQPLGLVLFVHGSGSGRLSPRNAAVAQQLRAGGLGTLLFDLLTETEAADRRNVFDIEFLSQRLLAATLWLSRQPEASGLPLGYFGASTGAAAALAGNALTKVRAPTLLLVGGHDPQVLALNQMAKARLTCFARLVVIPGASHLFEEPGTLEEAGRLAAAWFVHHFARQPSAGAHR